ncbi:SCP2 domain-containing protein [Chromobacterium sp. IIBBL 290-4]|uniref:ubiquinone anaerobic biosynthesis accessory factor UbiT n=1 Tax=Chromobacterium sp. IIBBL 290-4 TaxID=2953890 RepID=UPI0020B7C025|nr:SCP2 sterol-binding domain-containing protein [Chromobacterium sp. IIBBL 290-4]UTH76506.1 SCP2 sterol-binding domain-containing protein [Chromobacterium sp. IIBBL 290-4]
MRTPDLTLPPMAASLLSRLPVLPPSWLLAQTLNLLLKRGALPADMETLAGKRIAIHFRDAGVTLQITADAVKFASSAGAADLTLSAQCCDFVRMLRREEDPDTLFFQRKLSIEGDTELGLIVKNLLDSVDWSQTPLASMMAV